MTGIWQLPWPGDVSTNNLRVLISKVRLGQDQDGSVEYDFLSSHLPWAFGGIHGVNAGGNPWLVMVQVAPAKASALVGSQNPWWVMVGGLENAIRYNNEASVSADVGLNAADLVQIYKDSGVDSDLIAEWTISELVQGLIAECAYVPLSQIAEGRLRQCAFTDMDHECQYDVFKDIFAAWVMGLLAANYPEGGT
jgi:hypothetical protein